MKIKNVTDIVRLILDGRPIGCYFPAKRALERSGWGGGLSDLDSTNQNGLKKWRVAEQSQVVPSCDHVWT